ncbi:hypothetical protein GCM10014719_46610 [Planomonospora parontospora subsp. antibiotica]|nr:hypothetical protein GCM10014719_46610 [Planomonospora parontospora subsp. antibiotica]
MRDPEAGTEAPGGSAVRRRTREPDPAVRDPEAGTEAPGGSAVRRRTREPDPAVRDPGWPGRDLVVSTT